MERRSARELDSAVMQRYFPPIPKLVRRESKVHLPAFPVIDAHNHLGHLGPAFGGGWDQKPVTELLDRLDQAHVTTYVDLDGGWGEDVLDAHLRKFKDAAPERFILFGGPGWKHWAQDGNAFGERAAKRFTQQVARGAQGLKIWKDFGLHVRDEKNVLVSVDDARLDPLWQTTTDLGLPVVIHVADPVAFFDPLDQNNERWDELHAHPEWHFPSPPFLGFNAIIEAFARLVVKFPKLKFIGAHVGCYAENLAWVEALLQRCPNFHVDISARISELGRQPYTARRFMEKFLDRILFGIDCGPQLEAYHTYYRFLETDDEYFNYGWDGAPGQGHWQIYGLNLPKPVLEKIYSKNAASIFGLS
jgi:predicted TIM-barrel fold metal-dependent hydrolase